MELQATRHPCTPRHAWSLAEGAARAARTAHPRIASIAPLRMRTARQAAYSGGLAAATAAAALAAMPAARKARRCRFCPGSREFSLPVRSESRSCGRRMQSAIIVARVKPKLDPIDVIDLVMAEDEQSSAMAVQKKKTQDFNRAVLRSRDGKIIGGGDAPEPEGAEAFFAWMLERGCAGLETVQLRLGGGVFVRPTADTVAAETVVFTVPREAWLTADEDEDPESVVALVWRFLIEVWAGKESAFAPFVGHLRRSDLSAHPILWTDEEVEWMKASPEAYEAITSQRALADERVAELLARASTEQSKAVLPKHLQGDTNALAVELRWAVCLVEAQGVTLEESTEGLGGIRIALCPLLGDVRNTSLKKVPTVFDAKPDRLRLCSVRRLKPGQELLQQCAPEASGAWLLANLGIVPGSEHPGVLGDKELLQINVGSIAMLQIPPIPVEDFSSICHVGTKLRHLAKYAGLELGAPRLPDLPISKTSFKLPDECIGKGRLLPTARFLIAELHVLPGDVTEWINRFFVRFFQHCHLEGGYPLVDRHKANTPELEETRSLGYTVEIEVSARRIVADWCALSIIVYSASIDQVARVTGLPVGSAKGIMVVSVGQTVLSYYKTKRTDGTIGKSKKPREAFVISVNNDDGTVRVEFLANGRRHEVDGRWVVGAQPVPTAGLLKSGCTTESVARGKLAITLLRTERAILGVYMESLQKSADILEEMMRIGNGYKEQNNAAGLEKCNATVQKFLAREVIELDQATADLLPTSLDDLPQMRGPRDEEIRQDVIKPLWNMPFIEPAGDSIFEQQVIDVSVPTDEKGRPLDAQD